MLRKILGLLLVVSIFAGTAITAVYGADGGTANSQASVAFTPNTDPTTPVDPENPNNPGGGGGTNMSGPLSLDYVPNLDFGSHAITGGVETYEASDTRQFIQITDKRGTGDGWNVTAKLSAFTGTSNPSHTLPGAVINFKNPTLATTTGNSSTAPSSYNVALTAGSSSPSNVVSAANGAGVGMGTWVDRWFATSLSDPTNDNLTLTVNTVNAYVDSYKATIDWTLTDTP